MEFKVIMSEDTFKRLKSYFIRQGCEFTDNVEVVTELFFINGVSGNDLDLMKDVIIEEVIS